jgi:predicted Zn finger-like uncharacterized protein
MKVLCPNCQRKYQIDPSKIPQGMSAAKCKACGHSIPLVSTPVEMSPPGSEICKITCPNCQQNYRVDLSKVPSGTSAAKCKVCEHSIPLGFIPPGMSPPRTGIRKEPYSQGQPKDEGSRQAQNPSTPASRLGRQPSPATRKRPRVLGAVAGVIVVVLIGVVLGSNLLKVDWSRLTKWKAAKRAQVSPTIDEGQPFLGMNLNVPLLLGAIEKRVPEEKKDIKYQTIITALNSLQLQRVQLFFYPDPEHSILPVLLVHGSDRQTLDDFLGGEGPLKAFMERMEDGTYRLKKEAIPEAEKNKFPVDLYRVWLVESRAVLAPKSLFRTWEHGESSLLTSQVARLAASIETPEDLASLAIRIPENIHRGWDEKIQNHPALQGKPQAAMVAGLGGSIMSQLTEPLKQIESLALGFRFSGEKGRALRYIQQFRRGIDGARVYQQLNTGKWEDMDIDGIVMNMVKVLRDERFDSKLQFDDNRLALEFKWSEKDDKAIFAALSEATIGHLLAQSMDINPTEGPIDTQYADAPQLVPSINVDEIRTKIPRAFKQSLFPGHFWNFGDKPRMTLECDPMDIPNAALAKVTYEVLAIDSPHGKSVLRKEKNRLEQQMHLGGVSPGNITLNVQKGTPSEALGKAKIRFNLSLPVSLRIVEFKAGEPKGRMKESNGLWVKLSQLEKDVASVTYRGGKSGRLFAFDKSGRALASRESVSSSSSISTRFQGVIDTLKVVVVMETLEYPFQVQVDLNRGKKLVLSHKPESSVPVRYDRRPVPTFVNPTRQDLTNLQVRWADSLSIALPRGPFSGHASWEVHFFGKDKPLLLSGNSSLGKRTVSFSLEKGKLKKANAAFGMVQLHLNTGIKRLSFVKTKGIGVVEQKFPSGQKVTVNFDKNEITFRAGKVKIIQFMAYDAKDQRLKSDNFSSNRDGNQVVYFWGQPAKFVIDAASKSIEKLIPFDIKHRQVDPVAYRKFKQDIRIHREIVKTLKAIGRSRNRYYFTYGEDLAGLYYLYNKKKKPLRLIDKNIAHSDPAGQARFGYALRPHKGYYFTVLLGNEANGVKTNYKRQSKGKTFTWEKGAFTALPLTQSPALAAIPKDKEQPTFFLQWNQVYMKQLKGSRLKYLPRDYYNTGWVEAKFIGT